MLHVFVIYTISWPGRAESSVSQASTPFFRSRLTDAKLVIRSGTNVTYSMKTLDLTVLTVTAARIELDLIP